MSDMSWLRDALKTAGETSRWLKKEGPGLQAKAAEQMRAKKEAAAAGGAGNGNGQGAIPANSPISAQLAQLKGLLQMLPDSDPRKAGLKAQIDQLTQWAAATGVGGATPNGTSTGNTAANPAANPFAALFGAQQGSAGFPQGSNPFAALFAGLSAGMGPQQGGNPFGYQSSGYGSGYGPSYGPSYGGGNNAAMQQMMQLFQGMFAQQQQPPYR